MHVISWTSVAGMPRFHSAGSLRSVVEATQIGPGRYASWMNRTLPASSPIIAWEPSGEIARERIGH